MNIIKIFVFSFFLCFMANIRAQTINPKYLLFNTKKDNIVVFDIIKYYKIDENLFDINRYNQIDTISIKQLNKIKFSSVQKLWNQGRKETQKYLKNLKKGTPILVNKTVIETYNDLFKEIYIIEKLTNCKYKRTRVWWVDY
ncbi:hypothetical protein [uncultured Tenacibaculum sp.]|uniref:hypothetical protein n=1 Tax=uncultured Tenacibaculum sp. TaxID=174713 RepID=UPI00262A3BD6|nr:hypothetical protein [uncultured Tenacibaculum sp.]